MTNGICDYSNPITVLAHIYHLCAHQGAIHPHSTLKLVKAKCEEAFKLVNRVADDPTVIGGSADGYSRPVLFEPVAPAEVRSERIDSIGTHPTDWARVMCENVGIPATRYPVVCSFFEDFKTALENLDKIDDHPSAVFGDTPEPEPFTCNTVNDDSHLDDFDFHDTTDASKWTDQFCRMFVVSPNPSYGHLVHTEDNFGLMIGWFANAIERGRSAGYGEGVWEQLKRQEEAEKHLVLSRDEFAERVRSNETEMRGLRQTIKNMGEELEKLLKMKDEADEKAAAMGDAALDAYDQGMADAADQVDGPVAKSIRMKCRYPFLAEGYRDGFITGYYKARHHAIQHLHSRISTLPEEAEKASQDYAETMARNEAPKAPVKPYPSAGEQPHAAVEFKAEPAPDLPEVINQFHKTMREASDMLLRALDKTARC